ncbi:MAG: hypothetical protein ACAF41_06870 [Leptolyngbya sp. BL-A-14]
MVGKEDKNWLCVDQLLGQGDWLLNSYLSLKTLHCCDFQGGYFIDIDGTSWSDEFTVDEIWVTASWLTALKEILNGNIASAAFPWEESRLTLRLRGEELELEDIHWSGNIAMPMVRVPFLKFVDQIIASSTKFIQLITELENEILFRRTYSVSDEVESKLKEVEQNFQGDYWRKEVQDLVNIYKNREW